MAKGGGYYHELPLRALINHFMPGLLLEDNMHTSYNTHGHKAVPYTMQQSNMWGGGYILLL